MIPRIEWSPGGTRFVSRMPDARIRMHEEDGSLRRNLGRALDARWAGDDRVMSIDKTGTVRWHGPIGVEDQRPLRYDIERAWFAAGAELVAIASSSGFRVYDIAAGRERWRLDRKTHEVPEIAAVALSHGGQRIALAHGTRGTAMSGRGFVVIDLATNAVIERELVDLETVSDDEPPALAFDRAGTRLASAHPEAFPTLGVIQLGVAGVRIRSRAGAARAVALDERGMIAAYAYEHPPSGAAGRVQFDFLSPDTGAANVAIESSVVFDPDLPDVIAIGFDPHSRWLACLASTGAIEILPVP